MLLNIGLKNFKKFQKLYFSLHGENVTLLAGPNNSGKSTLLHALAVWSFCVFVLQQSKGKEALLPNYKGKGVGLSYEDFNPINLPDLKHLWHGLKAQFPGQDGYSLSVDLTWRDDEQRESKFGIQLALTNDRLFIQGRESNLTTDEKIPQIVYLPPVAGLDAREPYATTAIRRSKLGRGMAGSILRNILFDLWEKNLAERVRLKGDRQKIKSSDLDHLRKNDAWEKLQAALRNTFKFELVVGSYQETYHTNLNVFVQPVQFDNDTKRFKNSGSKRDLMVEGLGALQWICVYAFAVDPKTDILLLDEPDAHLHSSLQSALLDELQILLDGTKKRVFVATHSREVLTKSNLENIISFHFSSEPRYLNAEDQRVTLLTNLGEMYSPLIQKLMETKRIIFCENESDFETFTVLSRKLDITLNDCAVYLTTDKHATRRNFYSKLLVEIPNIKAISIMDRDDRPIGEVCIQTLRDKNDNHNLIGFASRTWRRREIENYAFVFNAIVRVTGAPNLEVETMFNDLGLSSQLDPLSNGGALDNMECKAPLTAFLKIYRKRMRDLWAELKPSEIHNDLKIIIDQIAGL